MDKKKLAQIWYKDFNKHASDLYPGRYSIEKCRELADLAIEIKSLAKKKESLIVSHNYLYPEFHEISNFIGDSLGLSLLVKQSKTKRVDFQSVFFMGATAKIINMDNKKIFVQDSPDVLGCSLVFGTDYKWIEDWKAVNPDGILITYINSDAYTKSISDYVCTSRNADKIILDAIINFPSQKILILPDKYLGHVMKLRAIKLAEDQGLKIDPKLIEVYDHKKGKYWASCYVHEQIGSSAIDIAIYENPDAKLLIHPECGCAATCMIKLQSGEIPEDKAYFLSTEQMFEFAHKSESKKFLVATEIGMIYRLRKQIPKKIFIPVSYKSECRYMKKNTFERLLTELKQDKIEIVICDNCCDPKKPYEDEFEVHIQKDIADKAKLGIDRMLSIK